MSVSAYRRTDCRLCHGTDLELALGLTPTPPADAYVPASRAGEVQEVFPIDMYICRTCGFVQLLDVVQPEDIYGEYLYETSSSLGLVDHFDRYAQEVVDQVGANPGSLVIDVGSNDGSLLRSFKTRGMSVLGIDPATEIARRATENGVETVADFLTIDLARRLRAERGPASIVTANNVIANIDDLDEVAGAVRTLLAPDGVFVFESFYLGDLVRNMVFDFFYHEHLSAFAVKPLDRFFRAHGLELVDALRVPTKGGSLRYTVQLAHGPRGPAPALAELKALETEQGLDSLGLYRTFEARIDRAKEQTLDVVAQARDEGRSIAGYGASATTTTLVYHFELGPYVEYLLDDYPAKQGLLSPGLHIPVLPSTAIAERAPDDVVVFAWRYAEPIARAHEPFRARGGRFVVPLPELRIR